MDKDFTDPLLIRRARELRADAPNTESLLWSRLRGQQTGFKFRRQHPVGPFIADFACVRAKLLIEIDGQSHENRHRQDQARETYLKKAGWRVARYVDDDVWKNLDDVVADIVCHLTLPAPT